MPSAAKAEKQKQTEEDHTKAEKDHPKADLREEARVGGKRVWSGGDVLAGGYGRGGLNGGLNGGHGELSEQLHGDVLAGGYGELSEQLHGGPSEHVKANRTKAGEAYHTKAGEAYHTKAGEAYQIQHSEHVKGVVLANLTAHQKQV